MPKDYLNPYNTEHDTEEEKAQAEKEDKIFRSLMSCITIVTFIAVAIIVVVFIYIIFFQ